MHRARKYTINLFLGIFHARINFSDSLMLYLREVSKNGNGVESHLAHPQMTSLYIFDIRVFDPNNNVSPFFIYDGPDLT